MPAQLIYTEKQKQGAELLNDPNMKKIMFDGGGRSGKTELLFDRMWYRAYMYPGSWHIILRKFRSHCQQAIWARTMSSYLTKYVDPYIPKAYTLNKEELTCTLRNKSVILCEGCDDEARVRKIFGSEYMTLWFNEATEFTWDVVEYLFSRAVQRCEIDPRAKAQRDWLPEVGNVQSWFDANPRGPRHWLFKVGVQHVHPVTGEPLPDADNWARLGGWSPYDNKEHLSDDAIATYEAMTGVTRRRMLDGEWCSQTGSVYNEFDEDIHVCKDCQGKNPPERCPRLWKDNKWKGKGNFRGIDFGYRDPFVCLWAANVDEMVLFHREWVKRQMTVDEHAKRIRIMTLPNERVNWTVADHDAEDAATLRKERVYSRPAYKDSPIMAGVGRVKKRLRVENGRPGMMVCQYCTSIIDEFMSYCMDKNSERDAPADENNHCMDVVRYMIAELDRKNNSVAVRY